MGDTPRRDDPQARVPRRERRVRHHGARFARSSLSPYSGPRCASGPRLRHDGPAIAPRSRTLKDIPPLRFGEGRECTLPACVAVATGAKYEWVMGTSGAAFTTTLDASGWDPLAAAPLDDATLSRAARGASVRPDPVAPPFDDEMKALVLDRALGALEEKLPPLVRGAVGPSEYGLIVGCDEDAQTFHARTFFDKTDRPTKLDWSAFVDERDVLIVFLDRAPEVDRATLAREAVGAAIDAADASLSAMSGWIAALRDDSRWSDTRHAGTAAFADHAMRIILADKRSAAASFLREARGLFGPAAGADLLRAAEAYGYVVDAAKKIGTAPFDASVAMRFLDGGHRRAWAKQLEAALDHERAAHDALRAARAKMR